jgi:acetyltransferase-like isoleucine patch superfamily enzyme
MRWPPPFPEVEIQQGAIVEPGVTIGHGSRIGYYAIVRGNVRTGRNLKLGSYSSIEGDATIGDDVTIRGHIEVPSVIIGNRVSLYHGVSFYDTPNPPDGPVEPPVIEDDVIICCHAAILGGITVGAGSFIGAHVFVTGNIPPGSFVTTESSYKIRPRR